MTIDNFCGQDDQMNPGSQAEAHSLIALEQSALYAARLAIARWISTSSAAAPVPDAVAARTNWYSEAHNNFQEWLGRGGFAQYDLACTEQFAPSMVDCYQVDATAVASTRATDSGGSAANSCME